MKSDNSNKHETKNKNDNQRECENIMFLKNSILRKLNQRKYNDHFIIEYDQIQLCDSIEHDEPEVVNEEGVK